MTTEATMHHDLRAFSEGLARLPDLQARAFRLRDVEGWPPERICAALGVNDEVLAELLYEARVAMCRALEGAAMLA
jgi:DNA-directed RNA polymerase specialized sigma24 family protein